MAVFARVLSARGRGALVPVVAYVGIRGVFRFTSVFLGSGRDAGSVGVGSVSNALGEDVCIDD